jgi:predicted HTH domain antitoxin
VTIKVVLEKEVEAVVRAGVFKSLEEALSEAVRVMFTVRPGLKLEAAVERFKAGEISLCRAAELAGTDFLTFRQVLADRGIPVVVECDEAANLDADIAAFFQRDT